MVCGVAVGVGEGQAWWAGGAGAIVWSGGHTVGSLLVPGIFQSVQNKYVIITLKKLKAYNDTLYRIFIYFTLNSA